MKFKGAVLIAALLATPTFAADESHVKKIPKLAGDSEATNIDEKPEHEGNVSSISEAFLQGKIKGLIRYSGQNRDSNLHILQDDSGAEPSDSKAQQYSSLGGYLGIETAHWYNVTIGATFYTSNPVGSNPDSKRGLGGLDESDGGQDAYHVLGEAFVKYHRGKHLLKLGRQEMPSYRFVSLSNIRMTPVTHQGLIYENTSVQGLKLNFAYIDKQKERNATDFIDMVRAARVSTGCGEVDVNGNCVESGSRKLIRGDFNPTDFNSAGVYRGEGKAMGMLGAQYGTGNFNVEGWNYFINDFINTSYLYGDYRFSPGNNSNRTITLAGQYAYQSEVGDSVAGDIDTWFYGIKAQYTTPGMNFFVAYNEVEYNESSYDGGTIFVRWGTPQMFNSFQVQDSELAGTKSVGIGFQYDLGHAGLIPGLVMRVRYGDYDLPDKISQNDARQDRAEATLDLRYSFTRDSGFGIFTQMDGMSIQFRLAYNDYKTNYDFEAYKEEHGFDFATVNKDFVDARIYLDYQF